MKKSLLALAALTAFAGVASAQSSVTLSGIFKAGASRGGGGEGLVDGSSRFILSGVEDLGGGLRARFQVDNRFRVDEGTQSIAGGNTFVGLQGNFGFIQIGKLDTHYCNGADTHGSRATALQASSCALLGYVGGASPANSIANASRSQNVFRYTTPAMGGLTGELNYSPGFRSSETNEPAKKLRAYSGKVTYAGGPVTVGVSAWDADDNPSAGAVDNSQRAYTVWGGYNFGVATVGLTYDRSGTSLAGALAGTRAERTAWSVPITVKLGAGTLLATYTQAGDWENKRTGAKAADTGARLISVGYDYSLSKRTSLGVSYAMLDNERNGMYGLYAGVGLANMRNPGAGEDPRQAYIGVRHTF